jgi:hypothetical protein
MPKEHALEIVRCLQRDHAFIEQVRVKLQADQTDEILTLLRQRGIEATGDDLRLALDAYWVLRQLSKPARNGAEGKFNLRLKLQEGLVRVVEQIDRGYARAMFMYTTAFYLGVVMVLASIYAALVLDSTKAAAVLGGLGMADVLASLIFRPAQEVQNSRGNLAQLQAAFFSWFNDVYNWNNYLLLVDHDSDLRNVVPDFARVREVSDAQMRTIEKMMSLIEGYCETRSTAAVRQPKPVIVKTERMPEFEAKGSKPGRRPLQRDGLKRELASVRTPRVEPPRPSEIP